jgi:hypothetical protein
VTFLLDIPFWLFSQCGVAKVLRPALVHENINQPLMNR